MMELVMGLDFYFPFLVLAYGLIMTWISHSERLEQEAEHLLPARWRTWFYAHRTLGLVCLVVGILWTLQKVLM